MPAIRLVAACFPFCIQPSSRKKGSDVINILYEKLKEVSFTVLPITLLVVILNFTISPIEPILMYRFLLGALFIIIGMSIFLVGADLGISPLGTLLGSTVTKTNKITVVILSGILLGFIISVAEPDLHILAAQVQDATGGVTSKTSIVIIVSIGIAVLLSMGLLRIIRNIKLNRLLTIIYGVIFILALFTSPEFLAISFDASGATTGALTVPFMLALGLGVSSLKIGKSSEDDSFGLVGLTSTGAILSVMIFHLITRSGDAAIETSAVVAHERDISLWVPFLEQIPHMVKEMFIALLPLLIIFLIFNRFSFKLSKKKFGKILKGLAYTYIGLILFQTGVNAGFMEVGKVVGHAIASLDSNLVVVAVGFILGLVVILAEPAVHVLTEQIENVTSGYIKRKVILFTLSIGVAFAVALSMVRIIVPGLQLWHFLLPGYLISIFLSYKVPSLFIGIAFDSGGVASGPMTATFVLAFAQGAAEAIDGANVLVDGFGIIAMVAMTPLIALQILGLIFKIKSVKKDVD